MSALTMSVPEAAKALGIGKDTAYQLVYSGALPHVRLGSRIRIPTASLTEWLEQQAKGTMK